MFDVLVAIRGTPIGDPAIQLWHKSGEWEGSGISLWASLTEEEANGLAVQLLGAIATATDIRQGFAERQRSCPTSGGSC